MRYDRDMRGYGANPPDPKWPGEWGWFWPSSAPPSRAQQRHMLVPTATAR